MRTINKLVFAAIMFVAIGIWAVASIKAEATYSAAAAPGQSLLTMSAGELPVQQFDAF